MMKTILAALIGTLALGTGSKNVAVVAPFNITLPEIVPTSGSGVLDTVGTTLAVRPGTWGGSASTKTYRWHFIGGPLIGTGTTFGPLTSAMVTTCVGSTDTACGRLQVDEIAVNTAAPGGVTVISDFVGPISTATPETATSFGGGVIGAGPAPTALPVYPARFLQAAPPVGGGVGFQHAISPGCDIPYSLPDTSNPANVWYFDSGPAGATLDAQIAAGVPLANRGHVGHPFTDPEAITGGLKGYSTLAGLTSIGTVTSTQAVLNGTDFGAAQGGSEVYINGIEQGIQAWNNTVILVNLVPPGTTPVTLGNTEVDVGLFQHLMQPGHVAYVKPDSSGARLGSFNASGLYSTNTGTSAGRVLPANWTWVMRDPSATVNPILSSIIFSGGAGWIFHGINVEGNGTTGVPPLLGNGGNNAALIRGSGSPSNPLFDIVLEEGNFDSWIGHSNDQIAIHYPDSGGHSDGTIQTASPYLGEGSTGGVAPFISNVSAPINSTKLFLQTSTFPLLNWYVWPPDYYSQQAVTPKNTGIPNGTMTIDYQGMPGIVYKGGIATLPGTVTNNDAWFVTGTKHLWVGVSGSWVDEGLAFVTVGTCAGLAPDCPTTNTPNGTPFVGCDPLILGISGGCNGGGAPGFGASPLWNGTTRVISAENFIFTKFIRVVLTGGAWTHIDWDYSFGAVSFVGGFNAAPNDAQGVNCISVKNTVARNGLNMYGANAATNGVFYGNKTLYRAGDWFDNYSSHRIIFSNNKSSEATFAIPHLDCMQWAIFAIGFPADAVFYGNAAVDNECYTHSDPNNPFLSYTQGIVVNTDDIYSGSYIANNIAYVSGIDNEIAGKFNVIVQNDVLTDSIGGQTWILTLSAAKIGDQNLPTFSMVSNNVTYELVRRLAVPGMSTNCQADMNPTTNNMSISILDWVGGASASPNAHCNSGNITGTVTTSFILNGSGFGATKGTGSVTIGGITATTALWSDIQITGTIPATAPNPTTANSRVLPNGGGSITPSSAFGANAGDVVSVAFTNPNLSPPFPITISYTLSGTETAAAIASAINTLINANSTLSTNAITSTVSGAIITIINGGSITQRAAFNDTETGTGTENITFSGATLNGAAVGDYPDIDIWSPFDYRSGGDNPLFASLNPLPPVAGGLISINTCIMNEFHLGTCALGDPGALDSHPNAAFVASPASQVNVASACSLPLTNSSGGAGAIGDKFVTQAATVGSGGIAGCAPANATIAITPGCPYTGAPLVYPTGLYTRALAPPAQGATAWTWCPYTPGIIGTGVALGAQKPPATHGRLPWAATPNMGVY